MLIPTCWKQQVENNMFNQHVGNNMLIFTCCWQHVGLHVGSNILIPTCWKQQVVNMLFPTCCFQHVDFHMLLTTCWLACCFQHVGVNMSLPICLWQLVEGHMLVQTYWIQRAVCLPIYRKPHYFLHHVRNDTWSIVYTILISWCWK